MVKILEKVVEGMSRSEQKYQSILAITGEMLDSSRITELLGTAIFGIDKNSGGGGIMVLPLVNKVYVYHQDHYQTALKLAERYEKKTGEEFILQKEF